MAQHTKPGLALAGADEAAKQLIERLGATPYNLNYQPEWAKKPYPAVICACVNKEAVHAPPGDKVLQEGDIVTYDLGIRYKSACGDAAITVGVGKISNRDARLLRYTLGALHEGESVVKKGASVSDITRAVQRYSELHGYNVAREFGGHGIGREMHEKPHIPNYESQDHPVEDAELKEGEVICIEPILTPGRALMGIDGLDQWTVRAVDGQKVAMFEDMILVKEGGYEVLTTHLDNFQLNKVE